MPLETCEQAVQRLLTRHVEDALAAQPGPEPGAGVRAVGQGREVGRHGSNCPAQADEPQRSSPARDLRPDAALGQGAEVHEPQHPRGQHEGRVIEARLGQGRVHDGDPLDHVALERRLQPQPRGQDGRERPEPQRVGVEHEPVAAVLVRHRHRAAVGRAAHHALPTLAVGAYAAPLHGRLVGQTVGLALPLAPDELRPEPCGVAGRVAADPLAGPGLGALAPPQRRARVGELVVQQRQGAHPIAHVARHEQHRGVPRGGGYPQPAVEPQPLHVEEAVAPRDGEHGRGRAGGHRSDHSHPKTPSRQP